jgi:hypothetical protein
MDSKLESGSDRAEYRPIVRRAAILVGAADFIEESRLETALFGLVTV